MSDTKNEKDTPQSFILLKPRETKHLNAQWRECLVSVLYLSGRNFTSNLSDLLKPLACQGLHIDISEGFPILLALSSYSLTRYALFVFQTFLSPCAVRAVIHIDYSVALSLVPLVSEVK